MSKELKTYDFPVDHGDFTSTVELFYLKSEADKVIAEKDKEIARLDDLAHAHNIELLRKENLIEELKKKHKTEVKELLCLIRDKENNFNRAFDSEEKEIRHHKYKRCLAMARWCASRSASWCFDPADDELHKSDFYEKWKLRWRELAEKFKPSNTTA